MSEDNIAVTRRVFEEAWNGGNIDLLDEVSAESYVDHDPVRGDGDLDSVKEGIAGYRAAFPDLKIEVLDAFASGDMVCARWVADGTMENEFMGMQATGEAGEPVEGITIDRFEDGKIIESWGQWNVLQFMRNIGAVPEEAASAPSA